MTGPEVGHSILRYFAADHLPAGALRDVSSIIGNHARYLDAVLPNGAEKTTGLRKLLEAKDCFVRAALDLPAGTTLPPAIEVLGLAETPPGDG